MPRGGKREGAGRKPGTVTKAKRELAELAKDHAEAALNTLVAIHKNDGQPASARVSAATAILDRAYGKPPQETKLTVEKRSAVDWSRDELVAFLDNARNGGSGVAKANGRDPGPDSVH
jgi:hypothetical protein